MTNDTDTPQCHRPNLGSSAGRWLELPANGGLAIATNLLRKDPRYHSKDAQRALDEELRNLKSRGTWDFDDVMWQEDAKRRYTNGNFARCFGFVGIKNAEIEDAAELVWKGRIAFGGDSVRTGAGDWAVFEDVCLVSTSMLAARILLACKMLVPELA